VGEEWKWRGGREGRERKGAKGGGGKVERGRVEGQGR